MEQNKGREREREKQGSSFKRKRKTESWAFDNKPSGRASANSSLTRPSSLQSKLVYQEASLGDEPLGAKQQLQSHFSNLFETQWRAHVTLWAGQPGQRRFTENKLGELPHPFQLKQRWKEDDTVSTPCCTALQGWDRILNLNWKGTSFILRSSKSWGARFFWTITFSSHHCVTAGLRYPVFFLPHKHQCCYQFCVRSLHSNTLHRRAGLPLNSRWMWQIKLM